MITVNVLHGIRSTDGTTHLLPHIAKVHASKIRMVFASAKWRCRKKIWSRNGVLGLWQPTLMSTFQSQMRPTA